MVSLVLLIFIDSVPICQDHLRMPQCQWNIMMNMGKLTTRITNRHHNQTKHNQAVCLFCCIHFMFMLSGCRHPSSYLQCSLLFTADTPSRPTHPWWKLADIARILPMEKNNVLQYQYIMTSRVQLVTQKYQYKLYQYWKNFYFESKIVFILHHRSFAAINYYTDNNRMTEWGLTHLCLDKMATISLTLFSDAFSGMGSFCILIDMSLKGVRKGPFENIPALV